MEGLKKYWGTRSIIRKAIIIVSIVHLIGCFAFPFATISAGASTLSKLSKQFGGVELPENLTLYGLMCLTSERGSDYIFFGLAIVLSAVIVPMHLFGKKRLSYVGSWILWGIGCMFEFVAFSSASDVMGYNSSGMGFIQILLCLAIVLLSMVGTFLEPWAQRKLEAKQLKNGGSSSGGNVQIDTEAMKESLGNFAGTSAAVAKKAAKYAVKGAVKATDAVKDFVEEAKNENGTPTVKKDVEPIPREEQKPKAIPEVGCVVGLKGEFAGANFAMNHGEKLIIGRSSDRCHLILSGEKISRVHCDVTYNSKNGSYLVTDYSENGTFTGQNGRLAKNSSTALMPGTIIYLGDQENMFRLG